MRLAEQIQIARRSVIGPQLYVVHSDGLKLACMPVIDPQPVRAIKVIRRWS